MKQKLLLLSNGHGEDTIAANILKQLQNHSHNLNCAALPIVGEGYAYRQLGVDIACRVQKMPSGGFVYMDNHQLWRDLQGGLLPLTLAQIEVVRQWGKSGGKILAVGDIVPLLFAWLSGADYAFVGTAKSEYHLRDEDGWLTTTHPIERISGSIYLPWERFLMQSSRCKGVFPRDTLTAKILKKFSIPVFDLGNPMMDGIELAKNSLFAVKNFSVATTIKSSVSSVNPEQKTEQLGASQKLTTLLLPGSRLPEAAENWQIILNAIAGMIKDFSETKLLFLAAIAPALPLDPFQKQLFVQGWQSCPIESLNLTISTAQASAFINNDAILVLAPKAYADCLQASDVAIAMAGTATEQFVGLGKPAISIPGAGPQFTEVFAEAQTRLLGCSIRLVNHPSSVANVIQSLLQDYSNLEKIFENGRRRMGKSGAAERIADCIQTQLIRV